MIHWARIEWIPAEADGRKTPPAGCRYSTVARFADSESDFEQSAWSVVIESDRPLNGAASIIASIRFLAPDAPMHYFAPNQIFWLIEGARQVAKGEMITRPEFELSDVLVHSIDSVSNDRVALASTT